jgi:hypothetical protein
VVAGISGFRDQYIAGRIPSADLLHRWVEGEDFVWLYSEDILAEYKEVLKRLHVRSASIGMLINFIPTRLNEDICPRGSNPMAPRHIRSQGIPSAWIYPPERRSTDCISQDALAPSHHGRPKAPPCQAEMTERLAIWLAPIRTRRVANTCHPSRRGRVGLSPE